MNKDTNIRVTAGQISADLIFRTRLSIRGVHITDFVCVCVRVQKSVDPFRRLCE